MDSKGTFNNSDVVKLIITSCEESADVWKALRDHFERDTLVNRLTLKKNFRMKEATSAEAHMKNIKELTGQLAAINAPISEKDYSFGNPTTKLLHLGDSSGS